MLFLSDVVLCETACVLAGAYKAGRAEVSSVISQLLQAQHVVFTSVDQTARAVESYARGPGDLTDYVIREQARSAGCDYIATFDKDLLRESGFKAPS